MTFAQGDGGCVRALNLLETAERPTPHAGNKNGDKKTNVAVTYVVEKVKPLASSA